MDRANSVFGGETGLPAAARSFLDRLIRLQLVCPASAKGFLRENAERISEYVGPSVLGNALVQAGLLTPYQADRVMTGSTHGLVLGNYRVLDRLGAGAM